MTMKIRPILSAFIYLALMTLLGCGGGGGGGAAAPTGSITLRGVAAKGPINGGIVKVYGIKNGQLDRTVVLGSGNTATDGSGDYTVTLASAPAGPVVVEVSGGSYTDEVSGTTNVALKTPLLAAVASVADGDRIAVTPLTFLAFEQVEGIGAFTAVEIDGANTQVGSFFKVADIIRSIPFDPTRTAPTGATDDQKKYAAALGIISQMVNDRKGTQSLDDTLGPLLIELELELETNGGFAQTTVTAVNSAITRFTNSGRNQGGIIPAPLAFTGGVLQLSTQGTLPTATLINGIDCTITLPAGVTVKSDPATGEMLAGVVVPASLAANNSFAGAKFDKVTNSLRVVLLNVQPGFAVGEFAHINFDGFPTGTSGASAFAIKVNRIDGGSGTTSAPLTGITIRSTFAGL